MKAWDSSVQGPYICNQCDILSHLPRLLSYINPLWKPNLNCTQDIITLRNKNSAKFFSMSADEN